MNSVEKVFSECNVRWIEVGGEIVFPLNFNLNVFNVFKLVAEEYLFCFYVVSDNHGNSTSISLSSFFCDKIVFRIIKKLTKFLFVLFKVTMSGVKESRKKLK